MEVSPSRSSLRKSLKYFEDKRGVANIENVFQKKELTLSSICINQLIHMDNNIRASFRFQIFPSSGAPIYHQLMDQITTQISSGFLKPGVLLPTVRQVAADLQINPMTVSKAYSLLERDGVLECLRGHGMRVKTPKGIGTVKERQEILRPFVNQLIAKAHQLSLSSEQTLTILNPLLKDLDHE